MPAKKLSSRNDSTRVRRSFIRHTILLLQPLAIASGITFVWSLLRHCGIYLSHEDGDTLTVAAVNTLAIIFSLIAAVVLNTIWENYRTIVKCVLQEDKDSFLLYRDERIPVMMHLLLGAFSCPIIVIMCVLEWHHFWSGFIGVFSVSFAITLMWVVAIELQNPKKSPWMAERIPADWFEEDIDKRFLDDLPKD